VEIGGIRVSKAGFANLRLLRAFALNQIATMAASPALGIIAKKRDGGVLDAAEIASFVRGAADGSWADYQLTAMLMAIYLRGLNAAETRELTLAMLHSGTTLDLRGIPGRKVDKHSTGGVGDKISLHLAPMVAACGLTVPMISGRGLGHTGGTLDKLESIPGFGVTLPLARFRSQLEQIGLGIIGQTADLAPADGKLYALRDVSATVSSIPLICASILSKKLAEGIDVLVLDVKFGAGAFMPDLASARELAQLMVTVSNAAGVATCALLTDMNQPIGRAVGNALEMAESIACLQGRGPADTMELTYAVGEQMLVLGGRCPTPATARAELERVVRDGTAWGKFQAMVRAQGGSLEDVQHPERLPQAPVVEPFRSSSGGVVTAVAARLIAEVAHDLGAGRNRAGEPVNPAVGVSHLVKVGETVLPGGELCRVHAATAADARRAHQRLETACALGRAAPVAVPLVAERIGGAS
jgi:pyrimidine-nucleoside phosphorylase